MSGVVGFAELKYLETSASVPTALFDFRSFFFSEGLKDESLNEFLGFSRREVRKVISEKARSGTWSVSVSIDQSPVDIGERTAPSSYR